MGTGTASGVTADLPVVTVVTPSFNQAAFLERAICSVLDQGYPGLQCVIVDGGSTDGSQEIIRRYAHHLHWWVSEPDRGQSHAINKGFAHSSGAVCGWLNSDDYLLPAALHTIGSTLRDGGAMAMVGHCRFEYTDGRPSEVLQGRFRSRKRLLQFWRGYHMHQPAVWWRREVADLVGPIDEHLHLTMDFDYWVRIAEHVPFVEVDQVLAGVVRHEDAKTGADEHASYHAELRTRAFEYWDPSSPLSLVALRTALRLDATRWVLLDGMRRWRSRGRSRS